MRRLLTWVAMSLSSTKEGQKVALTLLKKVRAILDDAQQTDKITTMQTAIKQAATGAWVTFGAIRGMGHLRWGGGHFASWQRCLPKPTRGTSSLGCIRELPTVPLGHQSGADNSPCGVVACCDCTWLQFKCPPSKRGSVEFHHVRIMSARPPVASSPHVPVHVPWRAPQSWAGLYSC